MTKFSLAKNFSIVRFKRKFFLMFENDGQFHLYKELDKLKPDFIMDGYSIHIAQTDYPDYVIEFYGLDNVNEVYLFSEEEFDNQEFNLRKIFVIKEIDEGNVIYSLKFKEIEGDELDYFIENYNH